MVEAVSVEVAEKDGMVRAPLSVCVPDTERFPVSVASVPVSAPVNVPPVSGR